MPFNLGPGELVIILVIALLVLGPGRLPEVGSALGKSIREFRKAATEVKDAASLDVATPAKPIEPNMLAPRPAPPVAEPTQAAVPAERAPSGSGPETPEA